MYANLPFETVELWHAAGWTMIHFLWLGTLVAAVGLIGRLVLRHATPNVRYATALACLILLAALPIGIIGWLIQNPRPFQGGARGGFVGTAEPVERIGPTDQNIIELSDPANTLAVRSKVTEENASGATGSASASSSQPRQFTGKASGTVSLAALESCVTYLPWLWIVGTPTTFLLLAAGIIGIRRLRRASRPIDDGIITETLAKLSQSLRNTKRVTIAVCDRIAAPVLVGILRPIILLPPAALTGWSPDEIEMVLLHELAHVRRWDNLINLLQRFIESLLFFHPAVWLISNWVRREREACCDALVVARTHRPHAYAELLVALAAQLTEPGRPSEPGRPRPRLLATSAMAAGPLRARIRLILQLEDDPMLISGKSFAFMLATLLTAAAFAVLYLPTIGQAEQSTTEATESTEKANPPRDESTNADQTESSDKARIAGFEKALQEKISLIVVMFNDSRGYYRHLRRTYERLAREGKTIYLFGMEIDPASNEAKRYGIGPTPTLIIFRDGKETARLEKIENAEQLNEFVAATLGRGDRPKGKFPSLEDQKLADLVWKRLQLELEPIGEEDVKRVQALGYDGGLRITSAPSGMGSGGILVGLHAWPTTSLADVVEVLNREDLAELSPLKYYIIDRNLKTGQDVVRTGRIFPYGQQVPPPTDIKKFPLRYDGKTFDEWHSAVQTELSTDKRLEAVKALAAFGRSSYGKEAAEAIIEIAGQYDWSKPPENDALKSLEVACLDAFGGNKGSLPNQLPPNAALPALLRAADGPDSAIRQFIAAALRNYARTDRSAMDAVVRLTGDKNADVQRLAWDTLIDVYSPDSPTALARLREALASERPDLQISVLKAIWKYDLTKTAPQASAEGVTDLPELYPLLLTDEPEVRRYARRTLQRLKTDDASRIVQQLLDVLQDESRQVDHLEAIRALATLGLRAKPAAELLQEIFLMDKDNLRIPAAAALKSILGELEFNRLLGATIGKELKIDVSDSGVISLPGYPDSQIFEEFQRGLEAERKALLP